MDNTEEETISSAAKFSSPPISLTIIKEAMAIGDPVAPKIASKCSFTNPNFIPKRIATRGKITNFIKLATNINFKFLIRLENLKVAPKIINARGVATPPILTSGFNNKLGILIPRTTNIIPRKQEIIKGFIKIDITNFFLLAFLLAYPSNINIASTLNSGIAPAIAMEIIPAPFSP